MRLSGLMVGLMLLFLPTLARAQVYGPPMPDIGSVGTSSILPTVEHATESIQNVDSMNPLSMLNSVGEVLTRRSDGGVASGSKGRGGLSTSLNILVVLTIVSLAPSIILMCTCFVRVLIVLGFLRQALGTQSIPPPQVVTGLALFATLMVMSPTLKRIHSEAIQPYQAGVVGDYEQLWDRAKQPVRDFMFDQIEASGNWSSVYAILEYRGVDTSEPDKLTRADVDMVTLVPAFMLSELKVAFLMGFKVFLPFLVIDMVISTMLISMSMMMLPPVLISLPFKILLFVLVDGWTLVVGSLMRSFRTGAMESALAHPVTHDALALGERIWTGITGALA